MHDWVRKINWELSKKLKFENTTAWYIHKPEFIQENEMNKILWDLEIQTDHLILARRADLVIINWVHFLLSLMNRKWKSKWKVRQVLRPCQRTKKGMEHEGDGDTICKLHTWNGPQRLGKETGKVGNQRTNQDHPTRSIWQWY